MPIIWKKWQDPLAKVDNDDLEEFNYGKKTGPVIVGPMGIMPVDRGALVSSDTEFWCGHTDFVISKEIGKLISHVMGVESIRFLTRYRMLVSFGKAFNPQKVMRVIDSLFTPQSTNYVRVDRIEVAKKMAQRQYKYWAVYKNQKGVIDTFGHESKEEVFKNIREEKAKGQPLQIFTSWG